MTLHLFPFVLLFHILTELYINIQTYSDLTIDILKFIDMKKFFISAAVLFAGIVSASAASQERPTTVDKLPANAQQFLSTHFKGLTVAFVVEDPKMMGSEYEVTYTDRTEVDFGTDGNWTSVERKYSAVPASVVPKQIADFVAKGNFQGQYIKSISRNAYTWEVDLSNGLEIKFDSNFNLLGYDD